MQVCRVVLRCACNIFRCSDSIFLSILTWFSIFYKKGAGFFIDSSQCGGRNGYVSGIDWCGFVK